MAWDNNASGSHIPAKSKHVVRLRQNDRCVCIDPRVCTGGIAEFDHVINVKSLRIERSHANDPALLQGLCIPCHKVKTQQEAYDARWGRRHRPPQEHPGLAPRVDDNPGQSLKTIKE